MALKKLYFSCFSGKKSKHNSNKTRANVLLGLPHSSTPGFIMPYDVDWVSSSAILILLNNLISYFSYPGVLLGYRLPLNILILTKCQKDV